MEKNIIKMHFGFTLIELVIVIGIISVLSAVIMVVIDPTAQFQKANDTRRKSDLSQLRKVLEQYYQDVGRYPRYDLATYQLKRLDGSTAAWGSSWPPYMSILPKDSGGRNYVYYGGTDGQSYWLYASLERGAKDPQVCNGGSVCPNVPVGVSCGGVCNYGVSSPNVSP